ncbi:MAG: hypothetical protein AAF798_13710 [Bacteroidota bacterium]
MLFFKNLPPKQQVIASITLLLLLYILAYQFAFKKTIQDYSTLTQQKEMLAIAQDAPQRIQQYQIQLQQLDATISAMSYDRAQLFEAVNTFCEEHQLALDNFSSEHRKAIDKLDWITNPITVSGSYWEITQLCYYMEQEEHFGHIASVDYQLEKDLRTKKKKLTGTIYVQNVASSQ